MTVIRSQDIRSAARISPAASPRARLARLLEEVQRGESDWTLPIILGGILLFVTIVVTIVLTVVELAALLA